MIDNFFEFTKDLTDKEREIMWHVGSIIETHIGKENAINSSNIDNALITMGINKVSQARLAKMIKEIRVRGIIPNLCSNSNGYYVAQSIEEMIGNCKSFIGRTISAMNVAFRLMAQSGLDVEDCVDEETKNTFYGLIDIFEHD